MWDIYSCWLIIMRQSLGNCPYIVEVISAFFSFSYFVTPSILHFVDFPYVMASKPSGQPWRVCSCSHGHFIICIVLIAIPGYGVVTIMVIWWLDQTCLCLCCMKCMTRFRMCRISLLYN